MAGSRFSASPTWLFRGPSPHLVLLPGQGRRGGLVAGAEHFICQASPREWEAGGSAVTKQRPREPRPFAPLPRPGGGSGGGRGHWRVPCAGRSVAPWNPLGRARRGPRPGGKLVPGVGSRAHRGNPGKPRGLGAAAARPRPGRPASAYRCRRPGHAESGAAGSGPAPGGCQSRGGPGGGGGWRVEIGAGGPRQSRSRAEPT